MESEEAQRLHEALEQERRKTRELQRRLQTHESTSSRYSRKQFRGGPLNSLAEEDTITNKLQETLHKIIQDKVELEALLEQEKEEIVQSMSRQVAQALAEKL